MPVRRLARTVLVVLGCGVAAAADDGVERARRATWDEMAASVFDPAWIVPETRTDPDQPADRRPVDLLRRLRDLAARRFPARAGATIDRRTASFADLIAACRSFGADAKARDVFLDEVRRSRPEVWKECGDELLQLARDEFVRSPKWDPAKDHERDGILHAAPYRIDCDGTEPWTKVEASRSVQQGATVFFADLDAIKTAENDYTAYPSNVGAAYEWIRALPGHYVTGADPQGRPFSALRIEFRCDLPFPYSTYDCDLRILNRVDDDGHLRSDIWSAGEDFYWMAGQDVFLPLETVDGAFAGLLAVRVLGFDLRSVPDGESDVRESLRSSLGNLKRRAEREFEASGAKARTIRGAVPDVPLRGVKTGT